MNPAWTFDGGIYFGCREPHLPIEYGYARQLLRDAGHEVTIVDGQLGGMTHERVVRAVTDTAPDIAVVTTAPSYLFWRCAPPELRVPQTLVRDLRGAVPSIVVVGPHASTTPESTLWKLGADAAIVGECEDVLPLLTGPPDGWAAIPSLCTWHDDAPVTTGGRHSTDMSRLPAIRWEGAAIQAHGHHHHRFDSAPSAPGAEMETSRGCPYHCTFCAKDNFRNQYRRRPLSTVLTELDGLRALGVEYVYFVDEIFLPQRDLLQALVGRGVAFGVQTRIDLWSPELIDLLGEAGCVSIEAGVESISETGRNLLDKRSRLTTDQITQRLVHARQRVPFVQANLIDAQVDRPDDVEAWRASLLAHGVWANKPVPMFPYPGSPDYVRRWGAPDAHAWERAVHFYLDRFQEFSDIQDQRPRPLEELELAPAGPPSARQAAP